MCMCERVCVCVWSKHQLSNSVCVCVHAYMLVCACMCVCEREREREREHTRVRVSAYMHLCVWWHFFPITVTYKGTLWHFWRVIVTAVGSTLANQAVKKPSCRVKIWIKTCFKPGLVWTVVLFFLSLSLSLSLFLSLSLYIYVCVCVYEGCTISDDGWAVKHERIIISNSSFHNS